MAVHRMKAKFHYDIQVADLVSDLDSVMECGLNRSGRARTVSGVLRLIHAQGNALRYLGLVSQVVASRTSALIPLYLISLPDHARFLQSRLTRFRRTAHSWIRTRTAQ